MYRFVPNRCPAARIKWESGENPEQSRCCKPIKGQAHFSHCLCGDGKAPGPGKSEDLQNDFFSMAFEELAVENIRYAFLARFTSCILQNMRSFRGIVLTV